MVYQELLCPNGLGKIAIHPKGPQALAVPLHGRGGHGDNRNPGSGAILFRPDACDALLSTHLRHEHVHQDQIKPGQGRSLQSMERLSSVSRHLHHVSPLFQKAHHQRLVYRVVFGQQNVQPPRGLPAGNAASQAAGGTVPKAPQMPKELPPGFRTASPASSNTRQCPIVGSEPRLPAGLPKSA